MDLNLKWEEMKNHGSVAILCKKTLEYSFPKILQLNQLKKKRYR